MDQYRTFWRRFWAGVIDNLIWLPLVLLYFWLPSRDGWALVLWVFFYSSGTCLYNILLSARYGQTLGKMATHVKVLDISEANLPSLRQAFFRNIGNVTISAAELLYVIYLASTHQHEGLKRLNDGFGGVLQVTRTIWFLLEVITMLINSKRRPIHDLIAGTVVVRLVPVQSWETDLQES